MQQKRQQRALELESRREELRKNSPEFVENESAMRLFASKMARSRPSEKAKMAMEYQGYVTRQQDILHRLGKPEDWLSDKPDCPLCGDRGYVGTQKCRCLLRALEEQGATVICLTPQPLGEEVMYHSFDGSADVRCYNIDATVMKTMLRANTGLVVLNDGYIEEKYNCRSIDFME